MPDSGFDFEEICIFGVDPHAAAGVLVQGNKQAHEFFKNKQGKTLTSEDEQKQRWVEHFDETLNQPEPVSLFPETAFQEKMVEIDANMGVISFGEVEEAIKTLKANKASGEDGIQAELLKHGGDELTEQVTKLLNKCWEHGTVPEEWTRGVIVKLPKKGRLDDCNNWRGVTLLSITGKVFCRVLLQRIQNEIDLRLREEQAGFRLGRSGMEQILTLRNILEQSIEMQTPLAMHFIDFRKAFDRIHRDTMWKILRFYGVPAKCCFLNLGYFCKYLPGKPPSR